MQRGKTGTVEEAKRWVRPLLAIAGGARNVVGGGLQCVLDFLIEDRCVLCGTANAHRGEPPRDPRLRALLEPVTVRFLAPLAVVNRPVCRQCLRRFECAERAGTLGHVIARGVVETTSGVRFEAAKVLPGTSTGRAPAGSATVPVYSAFMTNDEVLGLIHRFKFSHYVELAGPLGGAMAAALHLHDPEGERLVVAMPMSRNDRRRRGFNAVELLAGPVEERLGYHRGAKALWKVRRTARQSLTAHEDRADNVRGAFRARAEDVAGRRVLLLDDLVTSGATAASAAAELLAGGAVSVEVLCFARAL